MIWHDLIDTIRYDTIRLTALTLRHHVSFLIFFFIFSQCPADHLHEPTPTSHATNCKRSTDRLNMIEQSLEHLGTNLDHGCWGSRTCHQKKNKQRNANASHHQLFKWQAFLYKFVHIIVRTTQPSYILLYSHEDTEAGKHDFV